MNISFSELNAIKYLCYLHKNKKQQDQNIILPLLASKNVNLHNKMSKYLSFSSITVSD